MAYTVPTYEQRRAKIFAVADIAKQIRHAKACVSRLRNVAKKAPTLEAKLATSEHVKTAESVLRQLRRKCFDIEDELNAPTIEIPNMLLLPFTVICFFDSNGQIASHHVMAKNSFHAFHVLATMEPDCTLVATIAGHLEEGEGIDFPGDGLVDAETVLDQPEVFNNDESTSEILPTPAIHKGLQSAEIENVFKRTEVAFENAEVNIIKPAQSAELFQIAFEIVAATVCQTVKAINPEYDEEKIINDLADGTLTTTTWHDSESGSYITTTATGEKVAEIMSQEIDGEYEDYR